MDEDTEDIIPGGRQKTEAEWRKEGEGYHMEGKRFRLGVGVCICMFA